MDSIITAAALALSRGDPLGALNRVALRDDGPALALRGIAMAQLGDLTRARMLLTRAARVFGPKQAVARARCVVAAAEIELVSRDLRKPDNTLETARKILQANGDHANAAYARHIEIRHLLLLGHIDAAEQALSELDPGTLAPAFRAAYELVVAGIAMRRFRIQIAKTALERARDASHRAHIPALMAEVERAERVLNSPAARLISQDEVRLVLLEEVATLYVANVLIVDGCRYSVHGINAQIPLATRPVLFMLARTLAEAWPADAARDTLIMSAFRLKHIDDSHRARLRVEIGRLRKMLAAVAEIHATQSGFVLKPQRTNQVIVLDQPIDEKNADVLALLADGEAWPSSALALALGTSQRTVQRALDALAINGKVQFMGHGRARRWMTPPLPGITTILLLPGPLPSD